MRFSPTAWAKLLYLRDKGTTEVGGFGISSAEDLLYVEDICLLQQVCTTVSVQFDDAAVAEFFDEQVDAGRTPSQFARIWIHCHPGDSPHPSSVDEQTFDRVFGRCDWAVMAILAKGGQAYARLRYAVGPGGAWEIPVEVDFSRPFPGTAVEDWAQEYMACVQSVAFLAPAAVSDRPAETPPPGSGSIDSAGWLEEFLFDSPFEHERIPFEHEQPF